MTENYLEGITGGNVDLDIEEGENYLTLMLDTSTDEMTIGLVGS